MGAAVAPGGIGAAAGLLPILAFLAVIGLASLVWLRRRPPDAPMSRKRALLYGAGSALVFAAPSWRW